MRAPVARPGVRLFFPCALLRVSRVAGPLLPDEYDRDAAPGSGVFVKWARTWVKSFVLTPQGFECYPCFDTRRKFTEKESQDNLAQRMAEDETIAERFAALRRDKVSGANKMRKATTTNVTHMLQTMGQWVTTMGVKLNPSFAL